jgi:hypothetical protein
LSNCLFYGLELFGGQIPVLLGFLSPVAEFLQFCVNWIYLCLQDLRDSVLLVFDALDVRAEILRLGEFTSKIAEFFLLLLDLLFKLGNLLL